MAEIHSKKIGRPRIDLSGQKFGRVTVESFAESKGGVIYWTCLCECGTRKDICGNNLKNGTTTSCGCNRAIAAIKTHTTHGYRNTVEYKTWRGLKQRCLVVTDQHYEDYGGRGITVCDGIRDNFPAFLACVGFKPHEDLSLDRINNERGYECGTCDDCQSRKATCNLRWADKYQQAQNRRGGHKVTYQGKTLCLAEWSRLTGLSSPTIRERLLRGWPVDEALTVSAKDGRKRRFRR